jgi:acyl-CoA thioester hydrolase
MITSQTQIRVRYAETDKMGYVYYGDYAQYFEVGRVEALRELGWSYRAMEDNGIMLPVMEFSVRYLKPAYYDDLLTVKTYIKEAPTARIKFYHEIYNEKGERLTTGEVTLVFINMKTNKPCAAPDEMVKAIMTSKAADN